MLMLLTCGGPQKYSTHLLDCQGNRKAVGGYFSIGKTETFAGYNRVSAIFRGNGLFDVRNGSPVSIGNKTYKVVGSKQIAGACRTVVTLVRAELNCPSDFYLWKLRRDPGCKGCPVPELVTQVDANEIFGSSNEDTEQQAIDKKSSWSVFGDFTYDQIAGETWLTKETIPTDQALAKLIDAWKVRGIRDFGRFDRIPYLIADKKKWVF